jgi:hypothetical protein
MRIYPSLQKSDNKSIKDWIDYATRERIQDVNFVNSLPNNFIAGRATTKVPTGSTDNTSSFAGDLSSSTAGVFIAIASGSTVSWLKLTASTF